MESTTAHARWQAVKDRDSRLDGSFFYGVTSTRIFCRPGCAARRPLRKNTVFFEDITAATAAGFRPCRRCKPDQSRQLSRGDAAVQRAREILDRAADEGTSGPSLMLASLAMRCGVSPFHLQRHFKRKVGLTPKVYLTKQRSIRLRTNLKKDGSVLRAAYESGFNSPSRAYAAAGTELGMSPSTYRRKGEGVDISYWIAGTSLGHVIVGVTPRGVCAVMIGGSQRSVLDQLQMEFPRATIRKGDKSGNRIIADVVALIENKGANDIRLDVTGTPFQWKVWNELRKIPSGETRSYGEIARSIGKPKSARAVGLACAKNRAAIVIPCHRVVRGDGVIGEYRWGSGLKKRLLKAEAGE